jgi:hypothetical protein
VHVNRLVEGGPPHLDVGRFDHLLQHCPGDHTADGGMQMRCESGFKDGNVPEDEELWTWRT